MPDTKKYTAILDIGSNAVRLVIYDAEDRAPVKVFNERNMCGLGAGLAETGYLNPDGVREAYRSIARFAGLIRAMCITNVQAVATAALRDAADGKIFADTVKKDFGITVRIIDGDEEARLSALGVMMNGISSKGLIGDLGGGSLELILIDNAKIKDKISLPIGTQRLQAAGSRAAQGRLAEDTLSRVKFIKQNAGCDFYALGGAWRSIGRAHIAAVNHPLRVLDQYSLGGEDAQKYAAKLSRQPPSALEKLPGVSKKRAGDTAAAGLIMDALFDRLSPARVVFSGTGLREGIIFDRLSAAEKRQDPLIASSRKMGVQLGRFSDLRGYNALLRFMQPLFKAAPAGFIRYLEATALLSDIAWTDHEDYRAELAFERLLAAPLYGIDHGSRAFLASAAYVRYAGSVPEGSSADMAAVVAGLAMRTAYILTGGALSLLEDCEIESDKKNLILHLSGKAARFHAAAVDEVFEDLAHVLQRKAMVKIWK